MEKKFLFNCLIFKKNGLFTSLKNQMWSNFVILGALLLLSAACNNANNDSGVVINEIMASNHSSIMAQDGELYDWIELKNISNKPESLDKFTLVVEKIDNYSNDNQDNATQKSWQLPAVVIKPGECILIFASKKDNCDSNGELHADFKLPSKGGKLMLKQGENVVSEVSFGELEDDQCYTRLDDGSYGTFYEPTPGFDNNEEGYEKYCSLIEKQRTGALRIWELHSKGHINGEAWIEFKNVGDSAINLQDYCLTTSKKELDQWRFPQVQLQPGEFYVVNSKEVGFVIGKNKSISIYKDGKLVDAMCASAAPKGCSAGRVQGKDGIFYFSSPTKGAENTTPATRKVQAKDNDESEDYDE